jgi:hypothetical protein
MKKQIYIYSLLGVFFISTTGLPLSLHICSMNGLASDEECSMHKPIEEDHSCCSKEDESPLKITRNQYDDCCQFTMIDRNLTDQILTAGNDVISKTSIKTVLSGITILYDAPLFAASSNFNSNSSPPLEDNHLYLNHSILLI